MTVGNNSFVQTQTVLKEIVMASLAIMEKNTLAIQNPVIKINTHSKMIIQIQPCHNT